MFAPLSKLSFWQQRMIPRAARDDPEQFLRYNLIVQFANIGLLAGAVFTVVYAASGFPLCALLIFATTLWLGTTWPLLRHPRATVILGNYFALAITLALVVAPLLRGGTCCTGAAWLATPPLICLLIAGRRSAIIWCAISVALIGVFGVLSHFNLLYSLFPEKNADNLLLLFTGYAGLTVFVSALALSLERARQIAFTQFRTTAAKLAKTNAELRRLDEEKNEFVGFAAHDMKNPLCVILNLAEYMKLDNQGRSAGIEANANSIIQSADRMKNIVEAMLHINAVGQRAQASNWDRVELRDLLGRLLPTWQAGARKKNIAVVCEPAPAPLVVAGDQEALERIADNLVSNAIKFSPAGTRIRLTTAVDNAMAVLAVADQGPGIPPDKRHRLFQKYGRLEAKPAPEEGSHGLGLYIVKRLVTAMRGTVECDPQVTQGARFVVRIPLAAPDPVPARADQPSARPSAD